MNIFFNDYGYEEGIEALFTYISSTERRLKESDFWINEDVK